MYSSTPALTKQSADSVNQSGTIASSLSAAGCDARIRADHNRISSRKTKPGSSPEDERFAVRAHIDGNRVAVLHLAGGHHRSQRVAAGLLNPPSHGPGA